jgi:hypothetical protein
MHWHSTALIKSATSDLRDPKFCLTPTNELMMTAAEAVHDKAHKTHQSLTWFSRNGADWSERTEVGDADYWLWRTAWHAGTAYSIGYGCRPDIQQIRLYSSRDGRTFSTLLDTMHDEGYPNETAMVFGEQDVCYCLVRRDGTGANALLATAMPPYTNWQWMDLGRPIGGPNMIRLPSGGLLAAVRLSDSKVRTSLCWIDPVRGTMDEFLSLPSGGDTSYAGLVWRDSMLWVSYYSSHEGKASIYLARVAFD